MHQKSVLHSSHNTKLCFINSNIENISAFATQLFIGESSAIIRIQAKGNATLLSYPFELNYYKGSQMIKPSQIR